MQRRWPADAVHAGLPARLPVPPALRATPSLPSPSLLQLGKYNHLREATTADAVDRAVHAADEEALRQCVRAYFPGADHKMARAAACTFTNTPDEHFLLDRHPRHPQARVGVCARPSFAGCCNARPRGGTVAGCHAGCRGAAAGLPGRGGGQSAGRRLHTAGRVLVNPAHGLTGSAAPPPPGTPAASQHLPPRPCTCTPPPQVVLASACSGHGFKFSSLIGSVLADLSLSPDGSTQHDISLHRLSRQRKGQAAVLDALERGGGGAAA